MADWYVSSTAYAAIPVFQVSHAYSIGDIVRPTAPANGRQYPQRCTTAGTSAGSEPSWNFGDGVTTTSGGATFTNVAGQSAYGWGAAAGTLCGIGAFFTNRPNVGDRIFVSSDHSESFSSAASYYFNGGSQGFGLIQIVSVNRVGSVPPVAADLTSGATLTVTSGNLTLDPIVPTYWQGFNFALGSSSGSTIFLNNSGVKTQVFKNCAFALSTQSVARIGSQNAAKVVFDNTSVTFGHASQTFVATSSDIELLWINTSSPLPAGTLPSNLFTSGGTLNFLVTARGVDFSAFSGNFYGNASGGTTSSKFLLESCRIASAMTRFSGTNAAQPTFDEIDLVNCYDGTSVINERWNSAGSIVTDRSTYLTGGAQDDIGNYSLKLASSSRSDKWGNTLDCFTFDVENTATGSSKTATVEIISSGTLNNDDISLLLEYMGTSGNPIASFVSSLPAIVTAGSALTTSSSTWNSPPSTPQKQLLQVTFTPQRAGRVRGKVALGKVSTTVWVNPQIAIT